MAKHRSEGYVPHMGRPPKLDLNPELQKWLRQIGANLIALREERQLSQAELARRAKVSVTTLNEIESKRFRDIRISTLVSLAEGLDVAVGLLLRGSDVKLRTSDQAKLLKASEDIVRITKKLTDQD